MNLLSFFHLWLWKRSSVRETIDKDVLRWTEITDANRLALPMKINFIWLITEETLAEFRNLFYYRVAVSTKWLDQFLLSLARFILKPRHGLHLETPIIGPGFVIKHGPNAIVRAERIGENCMIFQDVTIGYKNPGGGLPSLGNHVHISTGAKVLGPVKIGDYTVVAANSVITKDMPSHSTGGGVPARVILRAGVSDN